MADQSIEARIVAALEPIAPTWNAVKEDSQRDRANEPDTYFTFKVSSHGDAYADDEPTVELNLCTAWLHAPLASNPSALIRRVKTRIHNAGFTWPEKIDASDDKERLIVLEFEDAIGVDLNGEV